MRADEVLRLLESNGEVFADADIKEYQLAQKTTWWGKPLDPAEFWRGRVLWLDEDARRAAQRHGREWPPMPYKDPRLQQYPKDDGVDLRWTVPDGPNIHYATSSEESAFWSLFAVTHPRPPDDLESYQYEVARKTFEAQSVHSSQSASIPNVWTKQAVESGYPAEAFSSEALFWAYVFGQRKQYQQLVQRGHAAEGPLLQRVLQRMPVEASHITNNLTPEQVRVANAWKLAYLKRLRKEKTDESYTIAYLKAWNLSSVEVFSGTNGP